MKYVVILGDGMADRPLEQLGNKTPLMVAHKDNIDRLASMGEVGLVKTVPDALKPGSDVANLSVMGYAPDKYYTGRSPLEAISMNIDLADDDIAIRCNLVTLSDEANYEDKTMVDYSSGEITTKESRALMKYLAEHLDDELHNFYGGISYRHCLVRHHGKVGNDLTPPHDISDKVVGAYLPKGEFGEEFVALMKKSYELLKDHPINKDRIKRGLNPANSIWLWGEGTRPMLTPFEEEFGLRGAVISAVDLLKGIGISAKMKLCEVQGATGNLDTNFQGKAEAAIDVLKNGCDYVYVHMEAPDECGHQGDIPGKIKAIELIDHIVVKYIVEELTKMGEDFRMLIMPDHPTPLSIKTHSREPVPYLLYDSRKPSTKMFVKYDEQSGKDSGIYYETAPKLMRHFIEKDI